MKVYSKIIWTAFIIIMVAVPALAKPEMPDTDEIMAKMTEAVGLTEEQAAQIRPLVEERLEKRNAIFEKNSSKGRRGMWAMKSEMNELKAASDEKVIALLTPEQVERYYAFVEEQREKMKTRMKNRMRKGKQ